MELNDKIFVVSGAGSGLGRATCQLLSREGAKVIAVDIKADEPTLVTWDEMDILYCECDVREPENVNDAIGFGVSHFGALHGAIACAGIAPASKIHSSRKGSHTYDNFMRTLAINLGGTFNLFNTCAPYLKNNPESGTDKERGCLIATSSVAAYEGQIGQAAYAASKGGVSSMILPIAREMARSGIRVNAIAPGIFQTPMVDEFPDDVKKSLANEVPFPQRLGNPQEFADMVLHIITNRYINGTVIRLDGGVRMK